MEDTGDIGVREVTGLSVVIPSKNISNFLACAEAVRKNEPEARIILVDDGVGIDWVPWPELLHVQGVKPFIFSRNVNRGIDFAGTDDVIIMNDDAILQTPGGLTLLQRTAEEHPEFGIIASTTNCAGNTNQYPKGIGFREDPRQVCFISVLIPRRTIESVGLLDERFVGYGMDDDDYSLRVRKAGLKIGIHDGCFVDHNCLPSSYRGAAGAGGDYRPNLELFKQKWGMDNWGNPVPRLGQNTVLFQGNADKPERFFRIDKLEDIG